ncbi:hypothetical protein GQ600_23263 [Phytophthora cactorum]|nr:hypothetical protein GQ600_23263 [Phytophthora cactorum]
MQCHLA